jgi:hypothetical protein
LLNRAEQAASFRGQCIVCRINCTHLFKRLSDMTTDLPLLSGMLPKPAGIAALRNDRHAERFTNGDQPATSCVDAGRNTAKAFPVKR